MIQFYFSLVSLSWKFRSITCELCYTIEKIILGKSVRKSLDEDNGDKSPKKIEVKPSTAFKNEELSDDDFDFDDIEDEDVKKLEPVAKAAPVKKEVSSFDNDERYKPTNVQPAKPSAAFENAESSNDDSDDSDEDEKKKKKPSSGSLLFLLHLYGFRNSTKLFNLFFINFSLIEHIALHCRTVHCRILHYLNECCECPLSCPD